jgi:hypothetical protein
MEQKTITPRAGDATTGPWYRVVQAKDTGRWWLWRYTPDPANGGGSWDTLYEVAEVIVSPPSASAPDATTPWVGVWDGWVAPFHACPHCGSSLNWQQGEDVFDRPTISASCCGVGFGAPLKWPHEPAVSPPSASASAGAESERAKLRDLVERLARLAGLSKSKPGDDVYDTFQKAHALLLHGVRT